MASYNNQNYLSLYIVDVCKPDRMAAPNALGVRGSLIWFLKFALGLLFSPQPCCFLLQPFTMLILHMFDSNQGLVMGLETPGPPQVTKIIQTKPRTLVSGDRLVWWGQRWP